MSGGARNCIYVYSGLGTDKEALTMLSKSLSCLLKASRYKQSEITADEITEGSWQKWAALLAIGGGYDRGFIEALGPKGMQNIKDYVNNGGSYLGICAGGYFGCTSIEFDKGGPMEVCGPRPLNFYEGVCVGPVIPGFVYNSSAGAYPVRTTWHLPHQDSPVNLFSYYNGGGYFQAEAAPGSSSTPANYEVLATYADLVDQPAAVVLCRVGKGTAVLTGIHFEYMTNELDPNDKYIKERHIIRTLEECQKERQNCYVSIFSLLGLEIMLSDLPPNAFL